MEVGMIIAELDIYFDYKNENFYRPGGDIHDEG